MTKAATTTPSDDAAPIDVVAKAAALGLLAVLPPLPLLPLPPLAQQHHRHLGRHSPRVLRLRERAAMRATGAPEAAWRGMVKAG